jgi:ATP-dependent helicase IRC3
MIGRGMRLHPGKENCHIIDMVSSLEASIVTTPTLFGLDPSEMVSDASVSDMEELRVRKKMEKRRSSEFGRQAKSSEQPKGSHSMTFTDYESVFELVADTSGEKHIRAISQNAWVWVGPDRYILTGVDGTFLRLEKAEVDGTAMFEGWEVRALPAGAKLPWAAPRKLLSAISLVDAVHGCDSYASSVVDKFPYGFILRRAKWRRSAPTEGQIKILKKKLAGGVVPVDVTKGDAADMITKLKFGAKAMFASLEAQKRRRQKAERFAELERCRRQADAFEVGPVLPER